MDEDRAVLRSASKKRRHFEQLMECKKRDVNRRLGRLAQLHAQRSECRDPQTRSALHERLRAEGTAYQAVIEQWQMLEGHMQTNVTYTATELRLLRGSHAAKVTCLHNPQQHSAQAKLLRDLYSQHRRLLLKRQSTKAAPDPAVLRSLLESGDPAERISRWNHDAMTLVANNKTSKALLLLRKAETCTEEGFSSLDETQRITLRALTYNNYGCAFGRLGDSDRSILCFEISMTLDDSLGCGPAASTLVNFGAALHAAGDPKAALLPLIKAARVLEKDLLESLLSDASADEALVDLYARCLYNLGRTKVSLGMEEFEVSGQYDLAEARVVSHELLGAEHPTTILVSGALQERLAGRRRTKDRARGIGVGVGVAGGVGVGVGVGVGAAPKRRVATLPPEALRDISMSEKEVAVAKMMQRESLPPVVQREEIDLAD